MKSFFTLSFGLFLFCLPLFILAQKEKPAPAAKGNKVSQIDGEAYQLMLLEHINAIKSTLKYETGEIDLAKKMAKIKVPNDVRFLNAEHSRSVSEELWGNPPQASLVGMLFPKQVESSFDSAKWAFVINYEEIGCVEEEEEIDADDLLKQMNDAVKADSSERVKAGYEGMSLVGWAETPNYDANHKALYWAKEFRIGGAEVNTIVYGIRVLGRKGVFSLNATIGKENWGNAQAQMKQIVESITFTEGNQHKDFSSSSDKISDWTINGLIVGKILPKKEASSFGGMKLLGLAGIIAALLIAVIGFIMRKRAS